MKRMFFVLIMSIFIATSVNAAEFTEDQVQVSLLAFNCASFCYKCSVDGESYMSAVEQLEGAISRNNPMYKLCMTSCKMGYSCGEEGYTEKEFIEEVLSRIKMAKEDFDATQRKK